MTYEREKEISVISDEYILKLSKDILKTNKRIRHLLWSYRLQLFIMLIPQSICAIVLVYSICHEIITAPLMQQPLIMLIIACVISLRAFADEIPLYGGEVSDQVLKQSFLLSVLLNYVEVAIVMWKYLAQHYIIAGLLSFVGLFDIEVTILIFRKVKGYRIAKIMMDNVTSIINEMNSHYNKDKKERLS